MKVTACEPNAGAQLIYSICVRKIMCKSFQNFLGAIDFSLYQSEIGGVLINSNPYYYNIIFLFHF